MELLQVARLEQMVLQQVCVGAVVEALDVDVARDGAAVDGGAVERERAEDDERAGGGREFDALGSVDAVGRGVSDDLAAQLRERVEAAVGLRGRGQRLVVLRRAQLLVKEPSKDGKGAETALLRLRIGARPSCIRRRASRRCRR